MAKKRFTVVEGAYIGTTDDRCGRWYIVDDDLDYIDKRGPGLPKREAQRRARELNEQFLEREKTE